MVLGLQASADGQHVVPTAEVAQGLEHEQEVERRPLLHAVAEVLDGGRRRKLAALDVGLGDPEPVARGGVVRVELRAWIHVAEVEDRLE